MGRLFPQPKLFYQVSLEERVPQDHLLRKIASAVDFSFLYDYVRPYYSHTGAPSVDPVVIFKMSLLGYLYGITSERKLAEECRLNLAFMWFLGYDLDEMPPDHSILSKARARFGREVYEQFFREVVRMCREAGLVEGDKVFLDATLLKANASLDSLVEREACHRLKETPKEYLDRVWEENPLEGPDDPGGSSSSSRGERPQEEAPEKKAAGKSLRTNEKWASCTDPDASLVTRKGLAKPLLAHKVHIAVDGGKARIVTAEKPSPGGVAECHVLPHLLGKHIFSTRSRPEEVVADRAYGTREVYRFLERMGILPTIPHSARPGKISGRRGLIWIQIRRGARRVHLSRGENPLPHQGAVQRCGGLQGPPPGVQRVSSPGHVMPGQAVFHHAAFGRGTSFPGEEPPGDGAGQSEPAPAQVLARDGIRGDERAARIGPGNAPGHG